MLSHQSYTKIYKFLDAWYITAFNLILFGCYSLIVAAYSNTPLQDSFKQYVLGNWLMENPFTVVSIGVISAIVYKILYMVIKSKSESNKFHRNKIATELLVTIDRVVASKRQRFADAVNVYLRDKTEKYTTHQVFKKITQPDEQIRLLIESLDTFFRYNYKITFKIGLMRLNKNEEIDDWEQYFPLYNHPKTSLTDLRHPTSTISRCIKSKDLEIISDVRKQIKKQKKQNPNVNLYIKGSTSEKEDWSQLCFPIRSISTKQVIYVITIAAKERAFFKEEEKDDYKWILDHIGNRLAIEHSLKELKLGKV